MLCCFPAANSKAERKVAPAQHVSTNTKAVEIVAAQPQNPPVLVVPLPLSQPVSEPKYIEPVKAASHVLYSHKHSLLAEQIRIAFAYKGIELKYLELSSSDPLPDWFKSASSDGLGPVLQLPDGTFSGNASEILLRVAHDVSEPSLFVHSEEFQEWTNFVHDQFVPAFNSVFFNPSATIQASAQPKLNVAVQRVVAQLDSQPDSPFLLGNTFSLVDVLLFPFLHRLSLITYFRGLQFNNDTLSKYIQGLENLPFVAKASPSIEELKAFYAKTLAFDRPLSIIHLQHVAIKSLLDKTLGVVTSMSHGYAGAMKSAATDADSRFKSLGVVLRSHSTMEQEVLFPALKASTPKLVSKYQLDHKRDEATLASLESDVKSAVTRIGRGDVKYPRSEDFKDFVSKLRSFVVGQRVHMNNEDLDLAGALASLSTETEAEVFAKVYLHLEPSNAAIMPVLLDVLSRQDRAQYVFNVKSVLGVKYPQKWSAFQTILTSSLAAEEMDDLKFRVDLTA